MASKNPSLSKSPPPLSSSSARTCLCSPTTHPGSFRCSLHRNSRGLLSRSTARINRLDPNQSKACVLKPFLMQIIRPSSHDQRRKKFRPRPTRFAAMNRAGDGVPVS
ncbi:hypothetical protein RHGRI_024793 [Rhododendron griersonianum]|uniref:Serine-rich protein-like protein n=1 Tax=Rhododendron griersonianum TaxID=479676 RepID=A0AAV6J8S2_9ERIC|nr:hypothetical protein RHGRI_024793 [Rhododendron griersonianum]